MDVSINLITTVETEKLTQWIARGAPESNIQPDVADGQPDSLVSDKDRQWWSFQPPKRPAVPQVKHAARVRNPIDALVLAKLEEKGLRARVRTSIFGRGAIWANSAALCRKGKI